MTKAELLETIGGKNPDLSKKQVASLVDAVFEAVSGAIRSEGKVSYPGFGSFELRTLKERTGRNPQTGEAIQIAASKTVRFKPAKALKEQL